MSIPPLAPRFPAAARAACRSAYRIQPGTSPTELFDCELRVNPYTSSVRYFDEFRVFFNEFVFSCTALAPVTRPELSAICNNELTSYVLKFLMGGSTFDALPLTLNPFFTLELSNGHRSLSFISAAHGSFTLSKCPLHNKVVLDMTYPASMPLSREGGITGVWLSNRIWSHCQKIVCSGCARSGAYDSLLSLSTMLRDWDPSDLHFPVSVLFSGAAALAAHSLRLSLFTQRAPMGVPPMGVPKMPWDGSTSYVYVPTPLPVDAPDAYMTSYRVKVYVPPGASSYSGTPVVKAVCIPFSSVPSAAASATASAAASAGASAAASAGASAGACAIASERASICLPVIPAPAGIPSAEPTLEGPRRRRRAARVVLPEGTVCEYDSDVEYIPPRKIPRSEIEDIEC